MLNGSRRLRPIQVGLMFAWMSAGSVAGQVDNDQQAFQARAERLATAVMRRPRLGPTFQLWWDHYAQQGREDQLVANVQRAVEASPDQPQPRILWGLVCEQRADWEAALEAYQAAIELASEDYYPFWRLGVANIRLKRWQQAAQALEACFPSNSTSTGTTIPRQHQMPIARDLATVYQQLGKPKAAARVWTSLGKQFPRDGRLQLQIAARLETLGARDAALAQWQHVEQLAQDPEQRFDARQRIAILRLAAGDVQFALNQFEQLLGDVDPSSWRAKQLRQQLDQALLAESGPDDLVAFWKQIQSQQPQDLPTRLHLARVYERTGHLDQALRQYEVALKQAPDNRECLLAVVDGRLRQGEAERAIQLMQSYVQRQPEDMQRWLELGERQLQRRDVSRSAAVQQAVETWKRALKLRPDDASWALDVARRCRDAALSRGADGDTLSPEQQFPHDVIEKQTTLLSAAEWFYREAVRRDSGWTQRHALGEFLHRLGERDGAVEVWLEALENPHANAPSETQTIELAETLRRYGYRQQAIELVQQAVNVESQGDSQAAWNLLIDLQLETDSAEAAVNSARGMRQRRPDDWHWQRNAASRYVEAIVAAGQLNEQRQWLHRALEQTEPPARQRWTFALLSEAAGKLPAAYQAIEPLLDAVNRTKYGDATSDAHVLRLAIRLTRRMGAIEQAIALSERLVADEEARRSSDFRQLAELQVKQNRRSAAKRTTVRWSRAFPADPEPHLFAASLADEQQKTDQQLRSLATAVQAAPHDLATRRQYADALRRNGQLQAALQQSIEVLDLSTSYRQKQSLLAWVLTWAKSDAAHTWILRQLQSRQADAAVDEATHAQLTIFLLESTGQTEVAIQHLQSLNARFPYQRKTLEHLIRLALQSSRLSLAIEKQQQLVQLDRKPEDREQLARMYRRAGQHQKAAAIWDELLDQRVGPQEAIDLIETAVETGQLFRAQQLAESSLSRFPQNWRLAYQASIIHHALGQPMEAFQSFQQLVTRTEITAPFESATEADALHWLSEAVAAQARHADLEGKRVLLGARHRRTVEAHFRPELFAVDNSEFPSNSFGLNAATFWIQLASAEQHDHAWGPRSMLPQLNVAQLRVVLAAAWAAARWPLVDAVASRLAQRDDDDPLLDWARLLTARRHDESNPQYLVRIEAARDALQVARNGPLPADGTLHRVYIGMLALCDRDALLIGPLRRDLERVDNLRAIGEIAQLCSRFQPAVRAEMESKLVESLVNLQLDRSSRQDSEFAAVRLKPAAIHSILRSLLQWDQLSEERLVAVLERLLPTYLQQIAHQPAGAGKPLGKRAQRNQAPTASVAQSLATLRAAILESAAETRQRYPRRSGPFPLARSASHQAETRAMRHQLFQLASALSDDWHEATRVESYILAPTDSPPPHYWGAADFPRPNDWLPAEAIDLLRRVSLAVNGSAGRDRLVRLLESLSPLSAGEVNPHDGMQPAQTIALKIASLTLQWWWNEKDAAVQKMVTLRDQFPQQSGLQADLIRMMLALRRLPSAQSHLTAMLERWPTSSSAHMLKRYVQARWTDRLLVRELSDHEGGVLALQIDPTGRFLASAGVDRIVRLWNTDTGELEQRLAAHSDMVLSLAFSPDGEKLASAGYDRVVRLWDVRKSRLLHSWKKLDATVRALDFSPDGKQLAVATDDGRLRWFDVEPPRQVAIEPWAVDPQTVRALRFVAPTQILTAGTDRQLKQWTIQSETAEMAEFVELPAGEVHALAVTRQSQMPERIVGVGQRLVWMARQDDRWQVNSKQLDTVVRSLALTDDESMIIFGCDDHTVQVWDCAGQWERLSVSGHGGRVLAVASSPGLGIGNQSRRWFASGDLSGKIRMWQLDEALLTRDHASTSIEKGNKE